MLKEAIEKIVSLSAPTIKEIEGHTFSITGDGAIDQVRAAIDQPETLCVNSLDSLVKMIRTEALSRYDRPIYINVPTPTTVHCFASPRTELRETRLTYYIAKATDVPGWKDDVTLSFEEAMISLRTRFQATVDTEYTLKLLSEITTGAKVTFNDNGIATTVVTQKGIALQGKDAIRPIVSLKPYRTFQEVDQPASDFLIRVSDRGIKFVEADGGMWRLAARETIKKHLEVSLEAESADGSVVIAL